jgi:hypothetical protein
MASGAEAGHALPYLVPAFWTATAIPGVVVTVELAIIAMVHNCFVDTPSPPPSRSWRAGVASSQPGF